MPPIPSWARGSRAPGTLGITRASIERIEDFIADNKASIVKAHQGIDLLTQLCVVITRSEAMKRSMGPVAARRRSNPALAYRIPVQRITGAYYAGWHVQRVGLGRWRVYNDTTEAYLIETGLYQRVRRPILKLSFISMLRFIQSTRLADRFFDHVLRPRRSSSGKFVPFGQRVGSGTLAMGQETTTVFTGSKSGKSAWVHGNRLTGPRGRLPG